MTKIKQHCIKRGKMVDIKKLVSEMTLEEKASLCSGHDFWNTKAVERLNIPKMMMSDGPHGLRKQDYSKGDRLGVNDSIVATCFPTSVGIAASFDRKLAFKLGDALGKEAAAENLGVLLGPAINIKRSPLCGRNFEYMSEDPYLAGELAKEYTLAVQKNGVGVSVKHFAANNQEYNRSTNSSEVDERTLREIYFPAFEKVVKEADPWTIMCAYNMLNGEFCAENDWLLNKVLREEWGFNGYVVSDWGAVNDRVKGLENGLELEMPANGGPNDFRIIRAVERGDLDEKVLDKACERILTIVFKSIEKRVKATYDRKKDHDLAREIASQTMVLLKNKDNILPLDKNKKYAVIGKFAKKPRIQGGGSSHINTYKVTSFLDEAKDLNIEYADGWKDESVVDEEYINEAVKIAKDVDAALLFVGLTDIYESEGYDRKNINLPIAHNVLIEEVAKVNKNIVIILHNGSPVAMPWLEDVSAVLEAYLGGESAGGAVYDILTGKVNPSAKLAETFPYKDEDVSCYPYFPGFRRCVEYREGLYVGYRYFDSAKKPVLFPFGFGLSYTTFEYSDLKLSSNDFDINKEELKLSFKIKNTGKVYGGEVSQIYVRDIESTAYRPYKELKGFEKTWLNPGETKEVEIVLDKRAFAFWNETTNDWNVETGDFEILVGASSQDIRLKEIVKVKGDDFEIKNRRKEIPSYYKADIKNISDEEFLALTGKTSLYPREYEKGHVFTVDNTFNDVKHTPLGKLIAWGIKKGAEISQKENPGLGDSKIAAEMAMSTPLRVTANFSQGLLNKKMLNALLLKFNAKGRGFKGFLESRKGGLILFGSLFTLSRNNRLGKKNLYDEKDEVKAHKKLMEEKNKDKKE
ncbi:MAG TPA: glycosyl hydrolase [Clostridiales bacterium]|nr:glycosyl hydrolase [Clostridiales bacterium]